MRWPFFVCIECSEDDKPNRVNQTVTIVNASHDNAYSHTTNAYVGDNSAKNDQRGSHVIPKSLCLRQ